jgi:phage terminase large subunit GpA-like protein
MFTAETLRTKYLKGFPIREWHNLRPRNEAFDCRVYAYAALQILNPNVPRLIRGLEKQGEDIDLPDVPQGEVAPAENPPEAEPAQKPETAKKRRWKPKSKRRRRGI